MSRSPSSRPTLKAIARLVQLSTAAVSLALRNHPSIPPRTCQRVQRAAVRLGYSRDAEIAKLMAYLRRRRLRHRTSVLGLLTLFPEPAPWRQNSHLERVHRAAGARAAQLGYDIEECWLAEPGMTPERMRDVLVARGIDGLLLLGAPRWMEHLEFDFSRFSCAATGYSIRNPLHRACQHQYQEMFVLLRRLEKLGYGRPGLALSEDSDRRTMHQWSAAYMAWSRFRRPGQQVPILIAPEITPASLLPWRRRHRPDVLISHAPRIPIITGWLQAAGLRVPEDCGLADLDIHLNSDPLCSGIRQNYEQVAAAAVDLVVEQIQYNERGLPAHPKIVLVEGEWVDGTTTRPQR